MDGFHCQVLYHHDIIAARFVGRGNDMVVGFISFSITGMLIRGLDVYNSLEVSYHREIISLGENQLKS